MRMRILTSFILACLLTGCATPAQRHTRERLAAIIIPEVNFTRATISDVVHFLHAMSVAYDPQEEKGASGFVGGFFIGSNVICLLYTSDAADE